MEIVPGAELGARENRLLAELAEEFPDLEMYRVYSVWQAFPKGTKVTGSWTLEELASKLRAKRDSPP